MDSTNDVLCSSVLYVKFYFHSIQCSLILFLHVNQVLHISATIAQTEIYKNIHKILFQFSKIIGSKSIKSKF